MGDALDRRRGAGICGDIVSRGHVDRLVLEPWSLWRHWKNKGNN